MKRILIVSLSIACLLLTACAGSDPGSDNPDENPPAIPNTDPDPEPEENNAPEDGEEGMEFDEDEGMVVNVIDAPPVGRYSVTHHQGTMKCPNVQIIEIPASPPDFMDLVLSEDLHTMELHTNEGFITLFYSEDVSVSGEVSSAWEGVLSVAGLDILYSVYWNEFDQEEINGLIYNQEQGCETNRGFTAVRVGP